MTNGGNGHSFWPTWSGNKLFTLLLTILLAYLIVWLGTLTWLNTLKVERVGKADELPHTITIDGSGKVTGVPNIATAALGVRTTKADVPSAQRENTEKMNALITELKKLGIAPEDIQTTEYTIYPEYRYDPNSGKSEIDSYTVSQNVTVKIRDLTKIGTVLGTAGELGLNQVSGVTFTIDEPDELRDQAREEALAKTKVKALGVARALGVSLGRVVGFSESVGGLPPYPYYARELGFEGGGGGPGIEPGTLDVTVNVSVTYEIE